MAQYRIMYNKDIYDYNHINRDRFLISKFIDAENKDQALNIFKNTTSNFYGIKSIHIVKTDIT